ncbi:MAG: hypothetical protein HY318_00375 [Armatimonadetes bacterium]|nr:hypothetical protein [Armatimonadota bacterium]
MTTVAENSVQVSQSESLFRVSTGPLVVTLSREHFNLFQSARLNTVTIIPEGSSAGFAIMTPERKHFVSSRDRNCRIEVENSGEVATLVARGRHVAMPGGRGLCESEGNLLSFHARISFFAGQRYVAVDYDVSNSEEEEGVVVRGIGYAFRVALGLVEQGTVWTAEGEVPLTEEGYNLTYEKPLTGSPPNWIAWHGPNGGLAISLRDMARQAPAALRVRPTGFSVGFYPEINDPGSAVPYLRLGRGETRKHSALFYFLTPEETRREIEGILRGSSLRTR